MKKYNKLSINSDKLLKNKEMIILRGGYGTGCQCICADSEPDYHYCGTVSAGGGDCNSACQSELGCDSTTAWGECL